MERGGRKQVIRRPPKGGRTQATCDQWMGRGNLPAKLTSVTFRSLFRNGRKSTCGCPGRLPHCPVSIVVKFPAEFLKNKKNLNVRWRSRAAPTSVPPGTGPADMAADRSRPMTSASSVAVPPSFRTRSLRAPASPPARKLALGRGLTQPGARVPTPRPGCAGAFRAAIGAGTTTKGEPHLVTLYAFPDFLCLFQHDGARVFHARVPPLVAWLSRCCVRVAACGCRSFLFLALAPHSLPLSPCEEGQQRRCSRSTHARTHTRTLAAPHACSGGEGEDARRREGQRHTGSCWPNKRKSDRASQQTQRS